MKRKEFIRCLLFIPGAVMTAGRACAPHEKQLGQYYHGRVYQLENKPLLSPDKFRELTNALDQSSIAILQKVSKELGTITTIRTPPPELPLYIDPESYPLAITYDDSRFSLAPVAISSWTDDPTGVFNVVLPDGSSVQRKEFDRLNWAVHLGSPPNQKALGPLYEGLVLTKEYLNHMIGFKIQSEFYKVFTDSGLRFTDINSNPIADFDRQVKTGASLFLDQLTDNTNDSGKIFDLFPMLVCGFITGILIARNKLAGGLNREEPLYKVRDAIDQDAYLFKTLGDFINAWVTNGSMLPPDGTTRLLFTDPMVGKIRTLYNSIYPQGVPKRN